MIYITRPHCPLTYFLSGARHAHTVLLCSRLSLVSTVTYVLSKPKVVIGAHVQCCGLGTSEVERPAVVTALTVHQIKVRTRNTAYWSVPAVTDSPVQVPGVKTLKALEEWYPALKQKTEEKV